MKTVRVGAAVLNQTPIDWQGNKDNIILALDNARALGVQLLCLPELCITGYGCEDAFLSPSIQQTALDVLFETLPSTERMIVTLGIPIFVRNSVFDAVCVVADRKILGFVAKRHLAGDGIHYEPRWFKPWPEGKVTEVNIAGIDYPFGDIFFDCGGLRIGFEICEDAWVANRPANGLVEHGIDIICNPSASHFAFDKHEVRKRFVLEGSRACGVGYLYSNLLGNEAGRAIYDGGALIASAGKFLAQGPRFSYHDYHVTVADIDLNSLRLERTKIASFPVSLESHPQRCIEFSFDFPAVTMKPVPVSVEPATRPLAAEALKEEEFTQAVALGLFDYLRKSHSQGFVVSLSGGADSAAITCLVHYMTEFALKELGFESMKRKLGLRSIVASSTDLTKALLTCVYQKTENSSATTLNAAREVAAGVGATFLEFDVQPLVEQYCGMVSQALDRTLSWEKDDLALQNIQARVRGPGVWMIANLQQALLLATSNRSEAAVGYTTMDGDTCGGLSPIAGIDKVFLRQWLTWVERTGPSGVGPISEVRHVNVLDPTAELRPLARSQRDEDDLMPYDLLDTVESLAILERKGPVEVFEYCQRRFPQYTSAQLSLWIERFFTLWCRNQWKRERYAPSFHLDDTNLDPKTWCRFPILSGGFQRELQELRNHSAAQ